MSLSFANYRTLISCSQQYERKKKEFNSLSSSDSATKRYFIGLFTQSNGLKNGKEFSAFPLSSPIFLPPARRSLARHRQLELCVVPSLNHESEVADKQYRFRNFLNFRNCSVPLLPVSFESHVKKFIIFNFNTVSVSL